MSQQKQFVKVIVQKKTESLEDFEKRVNWYLEQIDLDDSGCTLEEVSGSMSLEGSYIITMRYHSPFSKAINFVDEEELDKLNSKKKGGKK